MLTFRRLTRFFQGLATYDVSPEFSMKVRRVVLSPLGVIGLAAALAVLCGLALHPRVFALAGGLVAVAAAGVCWPWVTARSVRSGLRYDRPRGIEGSEVAATATVANPLPWPAWGLGMVDEKAEASVHWPAIGGRTRSTVRWAFRPEVRGIYPQVQPYVATGFPFGLWEASHRIAVEHELIVWPRTYPVGPVPILGGDEVVEGNVTRNKIGSTGDVLGVRPYRRGDSPRRIHWAQSARHDRLIVCELQSNSRPVVLLILDAAAAVHTSGKEGSREWAIRVLASLAKGWLEAGAQVGAAFGDVFFPPQAGAEQATRILDALSRLGDDVRPLAEVLASGSVRAVRSAVRVVVTSDAGFAAIPKRASLNDVRWAVLHRHGYEPASEIPKVWLHFPSAADIPHRLRHGTAEASHGS